METTFPILAHPRHGAWVQNSRNLSPASRHERPCRAAHCNASAKGAARSGTRDYRHGQVPAQSQGGADRGRVRGRQDLYGAGHDPCAGGGAAQHNAGDVPFAHYAQVGAGGSADCAARQNLSDRGYAQRRRSQEAARHLRSQAAQGQDCVRGDAPVARRVAAHGPQGVEQALLRPSLLHHRQGQGEAGLLLGARLPQSKVRAESRRRHQSRHRRCDPGLGAAEAHPSRLR